MDMDAMPQLWSETAIGVVCWTLVHSLWIGTVAASLGGAAVMLTPKSSARLRYNLLGGCLSGFALVMTGVLAYEWLVKTRVGIGMEAFSGTFTSVNGFVSDQIPVPGFEQGLIFFINRYSQLIFTIWLVFFLIRNLQFIGGLFYVQRIRTRRVRAVPEEWERKLLRLSKEIGITRPVTLLQSRLVKIPVTVGHLKPVILVPVGIFLQLSPGQIDTIILHELAHVLRRDYLVNALQTMLEALFFFNPGILWLSGLIRQEREACCDDIVLAQNPAMSTYLQALLAFQSYSPERSDSIALGLGGRGLSNRLQRMIHRENKRLEVWEKVTLLAGLLAICSFCYKIQSEPKIVTKTVIIHGLKADKPAATESLPISQEKVLPPITKKAGQAPALTVSRLAIADTAKHFNSIRFIGNNDDIPNREMMVRDDDGNVYHLKFTDNVLVRLQVNGVEIYGMELAHHQ